jgi:hypothetical protein
LIEGASADRDGTDPDSRTGEVKHVGDVPSIESKAEVSTDENDNNPSASEDIFMKGSDEISFADAGVVTYTTADVKDDDEVDQICSVASSNDVHNAKGDESSPLSVRGIETLQPSPDFQTIISETKGRDALQVVESKGSDVASQTENVPATPEMKHSSSLNSDEKSYKDIQQISSSSSDIIFDDVPSSPDTPTAAFILSAASPDSLQSALEDDLPVEATTDPCTFSLDRGDETVATQISPSNSKSEDKSVAADGVNTVYDADGDLDSACIPDGSQPDDHSVGSDQTPRRILQMN